jgi:hypothetical protein
MLMSSAADAPELQLGEEIRALRLGQGAETVRNRLDILDIPAARPRDLLEGIRQHRPGMLHFSGHGQIGELLFQANDGSGRPVLTSEVVEVLRYEGESIRLVVLGACHSESHAHALVAHVGCVVAMRGSVLDADARRFSAVFYRHLAEGDSVQDAFAKARLGTRLERQADPGGPSSRDVTTARAGSGAEEEAPTLSERFDGCAAETFLVRR